MNTLKSAALVVVLLGVLYGVYVALNKPQAPVGATAHDAPEPGAPVVEFGPTEVAPARAVPPSSTSSLLHGREESPASAGNSHSGAKGLHQHDIDHTSLPPPSGPVLDATAADAGSALRRSTYEAPAMIEKVSEAPPPSSPGQPASADSTATAPPADSSAPSGSSPALAAWSLRRDWQEAEQLIADGKFKNALAKLSPYYASAELDSEQRGQLMAWLDALAAKVIYSREHLLAPAHQIRKSETLFEIADQYKVPWRLLANVNSHAVSDTMVLVPGTELKVIPGPFRADVNLAQGDLTLYLGELYAGHFPLTIGNQPPKDGQYKVLDKVSQQKSYYGLDGRVIPANDPANPYGGWWMSLGGEVSIHGSPATPATQTLGCISLSPQDAKDVYGILSMGSEVTIRR
jgi:hypothetical protein